MRVDAFSPHDPLPDSPLPYADITNPQSLNKYTYTYNNPVRYTDPNGHCPWCTPDTLLDIGSIVYDGAAIVADVITRSDQLDTDLQALGADVVSALVPGLTGGGAAVRLANKADDITDAARAVDKLADGAKAGGRLGSPETRALDAKVAKGLEKEGYTVTHGGGKPQEYIPGPGGGRKGSTYPDVRAEKGANVVRVNTVDTLKDGRTPTSRERKQLSKIRTRKPNDELRTVPKKREKRSGAS